MKAQELRIGSLVKCAVSNDAAVYTVMAIDGINLKVMLSGERSGTWYDESKIKPIPLTEELLLKCGFELDINGIDHYDNYCIVRPEETAWSGVIYYDYFEVYRDGNGLFTIDPLSDYFRFKYLHQLQNLYFALTGEELEVKL
jgi:hypothetical protein